MLIDNLKNEVPTDVNNDSLVMGFTCKICDGTQTITNFNLSTND